MTQAKKSTLRNEANGQQNCNAESAAFTRKRLRAPIRPPFDNPARAMHNPPMASVLTMPADRLADDGGWALRRFTWTDAEHLVRWTRTSRDLHWLAPGTTPPLSVEKIMAWQRPAGEALVLCEAKAVAPLAYGEIHPMRTEPGDFWLGHVVVRPRDRQRGVGGYFVGRLLDRAFRHRGAGRVVLIVFPDNEPARRCYERRGFTLINEEYHRFGESPTPDRLLRFELTRARYESMRLGGATTPPPPRPRHTPRPEPGRRHRVDRPPDEQTTGA